MNWPRTSRSWARLKLTLAEYLVLTCVVEGRGFRSPPENYAIVCAAEGINAVKEVYFPKEPS